MAQIDRSTKAAREIAKSFYKLETTANDCQRTTLDELDKVEWHLNQRKLLLEWLGIRVFEPEREADGEVIWHLRHNPSDVLKNIVTIGIYDGHASVIKNINRLARVHVCIYCRDRFTEARNLQLHANRCMQGRTTIECPNERVEAPQTAYDKAF